MKVLDDDPALTPATEWHIAGRSAAKVDGKAFVTGSHQYTSDITRPGILYGKVLRPTAFNAKLVSVDTKAAEASPTTAVPKTAADIKVVHDGDFIAVAAAEAAVGLGIILAFYRNKETVNIDEMNLMRW